MANFILKSGNNLFKNGNNILQSSDLPLPPTLDFDPATLSLANDSPVSAIGSIVRQTDATKQPLFKTNQINGRPAIRFDGVNDFFGMTISVPTKTVFIVTRTQDVAQQFGSIMQGSRDGSFNREFFGGNGNRYFQPSSQGGGYDSNVHNKIYVNGMLSSIDGALRQTYFTLMTLDIINNKEITAIGGIPNETNEYYYQGDIARIIAYPYRMTELQRKAKEQELITLYAL